jgi:hypothetical protein
MYQDVIAFELGSGALAGLIAILVTVVILALIVTRIVKHDPRVRIARVGVFVERQRLAELPHLDSEETVVTERKEWPRRKEGE